MDIMSTRALRSNRKAMMAKVSNKRRRKEMNTNTFTLNTKFQQVGSLLIPFTVTEHDPLHTHTVTWKRHFLLIERDSHQMQIKFHADVFSLEHNSCIHLHIGCNLMWDILRCCLSCISAPDFSMEVFSAAWFRHRAVVCPLLLTTLY